MGGAARRGARRRRRRHAAAGRARATAGRTRRSPARTASGSACFRGARGRHLAPTDVTPERRRASSAPRSRSSTSPGSSCRRRGGAAASTITITSSRATRGSRRASIRQLARAIEVLGEELAVAAGAAPIRRARDARDHPRRSVPRQRAVGRRPSRGDPRLRAGLGRQPRVRPRGLHQRLVLDRRAAPRPRRPRCSRATSASGRCTAADRAALPIEVRAAAARFTITRITDVYLARVDNPEKDFRAFLARCEAWRGPALGQLTSLL